MKKIIFGIITIVLLIIIVSFTQQQPTEKAFARVNKVNNKLAFYWNEPINNYEVVFTFGNLITNYNCSSPKQVLDQSVNNANKEAANQGKLYDAIIIGHATKRDLAIVFTDKTKDNAIARVTKNEGKYLFIECEPLNDYDVVGKYNVSGFGQVVLTGDCPSHQSKIDKLMKKATKDHLEFDGIIFGSSKNDLVIKIK